jgi:hypothetical protein
MDYLFCGEWAMTEVAAQYDLFDQPLPVDYVRNHAIFHDIEPHIREAFFTYHSDNPNVYRLFKKYSFQAKEKWSHFSGRDIMSRIRWDESIVVNGEFKANNSYVSCLVRMLIIEHPIFSDFFERRGHNSCE